MAETLILDQSSGDGADYNLLILSGYNFTAAATVTVTVLDQQNETIATTHDTITVDANGRFHDAKVWLPRIEQRGAVTITATPSAGSPATSSYTIRHCNVTTPNEMGNKINMVKQASNGTDSFDTTSTPTEERVEEMIRQVEDLFEKMTGVPIHNTTHQRYFDTDGSLTLETKTFPILKVNNATYYNGAEYASFSNSWQRARDETKSFWWDRKGTIRFESENPSAYREGLYLDFIVGPENRIARDIIQAIESKVASIMLNNKEYYKVFRMGGVEADIIDKRGEYERVWQETVDSYRRALRVVN